MEKNWNEKIIMRLRLVFSVAFLLVSLSVLAGTAYGWMRNQRTLQTIAAIETPFLLDIRGGDEKSISYLDLNGLDLSDPDSKSQIVFCVCGEGIDSYSLELGYTTNIGLEYKIYPAVKATEASGEYTVQCIDWQNGNNTSYYYNSAGLASQKLNESSAGSGLGNLNDAYYDATYGSGFDTAYVQKNGMPIYELISGIRVRDTVGSAELQFAFVDYYVLEVSWTDDATGENNKETDMVYLMAESAG